MYLYRLQTLLMVPAHYLRHRRVTKMIHFPEKPQRTKKEPGGGNNSANAMHIISSLSISAWCHLPAISLVPSEKTTKLNHSTHTDTVAWCIPVHKTPRELSPVSSSLETSTLDLVIESPIKPRSTTWKSDISRQVFSSTSQDNCQLKSTWIANKNDA